ncbi:Cof-type HAD-IIB family hydrolase [Peptostreptococcaceae bacterium AGR-M142]
MKYKLIVTDMDGTLLSSNKTISKRNKETIKCIMDKGYNVAIATGRMYDSAKYFAKVLDLNLPIIACNGGIVKNPITKEVLYKNFIEINKLKKVLDICDDMNIYYHCYDDEIFYSKEEKYSTKFNLDWNKDKDEDDKLNILVDKNIKKILIEERKEILKILIIDEDVSKLKELRKKLENISDIEISSSLKTNLEVMKKNVSKGNALELLCEKLNIKLNEVIALGDNENDLSMLNIAGLSVGMGNADEYIKQKVDFVTLNNDEDGVAYALKEILDEEGIC